MLTHKELYVKVPKLPEMNPNKELFVKVTNQTKINSHKELFVKISKLPDRVLPYSSEVNSYKGLFVKLTKLPDKMSVLPHTGEKKESPNLHNLRSLARKNYLEESALHSFEEKDQINGDVAPNLKNHVIPIYRKQIPDDPKVQQEDMYEFIDMSPKLKTKKKTRPHRSSILFDKDTYNILKKIEEKEAKIKRKAINSKMKVLKPVQRKSYPEIIDNILSNVKKKIKQKNKPTVVEKQSENKQEIPESNLANNNTGLKVTLDVPCREEKITRINSNKSIPGENKLRCETVTNNSDKKSVNTFQPSPYPSYYDENINISSVHNNLEVTEKDLESCFGFVNDDNDEAVVNSTSVQSTKKNFVNILGNVLLKNGNIVDESPVHFNLRRPNANSTMINSKTPERISSPWRLNFVNVRRNPHFLSLKNNAMPRIDQEPILDHSLVNGFENSVSKDSENRQTVQKKSPIQQSILDYIESNIEKERDVLPHRLFDSEAFESPVKKNNQGKENLQVHEAKKNLSTNTNIVASTPVKRRVFADISNFSEELVIPENNKDSLFGFNETTLNSLQNSQEKNKQKNIWENNENDVNSKPSRFDIAVLKSYSSKQKTKKKEPSAKLTEPVEAQNESISLMNLSENHGDEIHLFEEPEEILDNMSPIKICKKRTRGKRFNSTDSDQDDQETKRKRHRKTKLEIEQEKWIEEFNRICKETDQYELEIE